MTHISAQVVIIEGRYVRQRCAWCGEMLIDYDLEKTAVVVVNGKTELPGVWATDRLIHVDGNQSTLLEGNAMPPDCCAMLELTR